MSELDLQNDCFHCGLPNEQADVRSLTVFDEVQHFCCHGCRAVCETIIQSGLASFYSHRTDEYKAGSKLSAADSASQALGLTLYDRPEIKSQFILEQNGTEQAYLLLEDIHCAACVWLNEHHLRQLDSVVSVSIDSVSHRANVRWQPELISLSQILHAIADIGYRAYPFDPAQHQKQLENRRQKSMEKLIFSGIFGMFIMNFSIATYFMGTSITGEPMQFWEKGGQWISLFLSSLLLVYPGRVFFSSAWRAISRRTINMDVPIAIGLSAAFLGSAVAVFSRQGDVYFDAIAMFVFFILLSRRFELKGQLYASSFLSRLSQRSLKIAERVEPDQTRQSVAVSDLKIGDVVSVLPGAVLPIDGVLISAFAELDESLLTGESILKRRQQGANVHAGSVNGTQAILIAVMNENTDSTLDHIHRLVLRSSESKTPAERWMHQIASRFVLALLVITSATMAYWLWQGSAEWLSYTIAVLIVTCPCALALAIPVAHSITTGRLLSFGVLPLRPEALNSLAKASTVVLDKTGTLTESRISFVEHCFETDENVPETLALIGQMSAQSEHPIAKAIIAHYGESTLGAIEVNNHPGHGLSTVINGEEVRLGAFDFVQPDLMRSESMRKKLKMWERKGYQIIAFAGGADHGTAYFAFSNPLRKGVQTMLEQLRSLGIKKIIIASGDHPESVTVLANTLAVDEVAARLMPADKLDLIKSLKAQGERVVMIGDGLNDAPTLAAADVSISLASGADLAKVNSDFILLGDDLSKVASLMLMAQKTQAVVWQNISWAVLYNLMMVPAAAAGFIQPWIAALGMSISAILVVSNSLRLRKTSLERTRRTQDESKHAFVKSSAA
ncbi:MAG: heavy metal translocating P-type ATPase [Arenicellales bacterium]